MRYDDAQPTSDLSADALSVATKEQIQEERAALRDRFDTRTPSSRPSGLIAITYGLLAASLAHLTQGFVFSDDSAWEYERFPAEPVDFMSWYFDPTQTRDPNFAEWAQRCIDGIDDELGENV